MLQTQWEEFLKDLQYAPVHDALTAGLKNMQKWYRKTDDTSIYFISHGKDSAIILTKQLILFVLVLDPTRKLSYVKVAWEAEWVNRNMDRLRKIVRYSRYITSRT
jgi:hypothetical protein